MPCMGSHRTLSEQFPFPRLCFSITLSTYMSYRETERAKPSTKLSARLMHTWESSMPTLWILLHSLPSTPPHRPPFSEWKPVEWSRFQIATRLFVLVSLQSILFLQHGILLLCYFFIPLTRALHTRTIHGTFPNLEPKCKACVCVQISILPFAVLRLLPLQFDLAHAFYMCVRSKGENLIILSPNEWINDKAYQTIDKGSSSKAWRYDIFTLGSHMHSRTLAHFHAECRLLHSFAQLTFPTFCMHACISLIFTIVYGQWALSHSMFNAFYYYYLIVHTDMVVLDMKIVLQFNIISYCFCCGCYRYWTASYGYAKRKVIEMESWQNKSERNRKHLHFHCVLCLIGWKIHQSS